MIIKSLCNSCLQPYELRVDLSEVQLVKEITDDQGISCPCPRLCGGVINLVGDSVIEQMSGDRRLREPLIISGKELYRAVKGIGLPDEIPTKKEVVESLLRKSSIDSVDLEEFNGRIFLHEITLTDGAVIHLGSGLKGSQVLKITKRAQNG